MPELLLELLSEEIPARMQADAAGQLRAHLLAQFAKAQVVVEPGKVRSFVTPRRLVVVFDDLPARTLATQEERRGPRVGAPAAAIEGFLKSAGLASPAEAEQRDTGKGVFYFAVTVRPGRPMDEVAKEAIEHVVRLLPWPKSMRFPAAPFRWVRPLVSALCLFDRRVLPLDLGAVPVGAVTQGHRFLAPEPFAVAGFADYRERLRAAHVVLDPEERRSLIAEGLAGAASGAGLRLKADPVLLDEVTGLVEFPVVLAGRIDGRFMELPPEVLTAAMRAHQKYFALIDAAGALAPRFLFVANTAAADGGAAIIAGNERVLRARLADARFFWDLDRKTPLAARVPKLAERIFHAYVTMLAKIGRVEALTGLITRHVDRADLDLTKRAAHLAKADLSSGMVGEFPELQGIMGRYYALHDGEPAEIADAIADHYSPLGPNDRCPTAPTSVVVALADKIDTLVHFFAAGEKPTGSKDPFALRRAALGVIRIILENNLRLPLKAVFARANHLQAETDIGAIGAASVAELLDFFADRLKVHLREEGVRHDLIAAVFALGGEDDLVRLIARVAALGEFLASEDGANLVVAYRRAANIVRIEAGKDKRGYDGPPDPDLLQMTEERALAERLAEVERSSAAALGEEAFATAMAALASLRRPVDDFFDRVTVNCADPGLRENRLRLLSQIRATLNRVADFSLIEG